MSRRTLTIILAASVLLCFAAHTTIAAPHAHDFSNQKPSNASRSYTSWCSERDFGPYQAARSTEEIHWGYEGEAGSSYWAQLTPDYATCNDGRQQSPINIHFAPVSNNGRLALHWSPLAQPIQVANNGHAFQIDVAGNPLGRNSFLVFEGVTYYFLQFHFHGPSEHRVNGRHYPMELHAVHRSDAGAYLVLGIFLEFGSERNYFFDYLIPQIPETASIVEVQDDIQWKAIMADIHTQDFYEYHGSFTTPPCTEGVQWIVLAQPINVARRFIATHSDLIHYNARHTQPVHDQVYTEAPPSEH